MAELQFVFDLADEKKLYGILQASTDPDAPVVVFTHDLDFGNILAATDAFGPSVIQVRAQDPIPESVGEFILAALRDYAGHLERGALITIEPDRLRARVLPILRHRH